MASTLQRVRWRLSAFYYGRCLTGFPWYWPSTPPGMQAMADARQLVRSHFGRHQPGWRRALARLFTALAWPPAVVFHLWQIRRERGADAVPLRHMPGAAWAAMRHNILPGEYYAYQLWHPDRRSRVDDYLYCNEAPRLFGVLNRPPSPNPIDDKLAFHALCSANAIPTPPVLAAFDPGNRARGFGPHGPPQYDLFVKPRFGNSGRLTEALRWTEGGYTNRFGEKIAAADIDAYLADRAKDLRRALLVQPLLRNHPGLPVADKERLEPARLVTGRSPDGRVVPIYGAFYVDRLGSSPAMDTRAALIDVQSGRLIGKAARGSPVLPDWANGVRAALSAHAACAGFPFVGWDIALTDRGSVLLEGNANWCADEYQALSGAPLGNTVFSDILSDHLHSRPDLPGLRVRAKG